MDNTRWLARVAIHVVVAVVAELVAVGCSPMDGRGEQRPAVPPPLEAASPAVAGATSEQGHARSESRAAHVPDMAPEPSAARVAGLSMEPYFGAGSGARARQMFGRGAYQEALAAFDALSASGSEERLQAKYLAAVAALYAGRHTEAAQRFGDLAPQYPVLAEYCHYFAAEALLKGGKPAEALTWLDKVSSKGANAERASSLRAEVYSANKDHARAKAQWEEHFKEHSATAESKLAYGAALLELGKVEEAAKAFRAVIARWPLGGKQEEAERWLKKAVAKLPAGAQAAHKGLNAKEQLERGRQLYEAHRSKEAISQLEAVAAQFKVGSAEYCEALYLSARSWDKLRKRPQAHPVYETARRGCDKSSFAKDILYFGGLSFYRSGKNTKAQDYFEALHKNFPKASTNDDALIWEAAMQAERGNSKARRALLQRALDDYPNGDMAHEAAWLLVWDAVQASDWKRAVKAADAAIARKETINREYARGREAYWKARAQQKLKLKSDALDGYRSVLKGFPLSWYGLLAYARIAELEGPKAAAEALALAVGQSEAPQTPISALVSSELAEHPALQAGLELIRLGLDAPARRELARLRDGAGKKADWVLALLYDRSGAPHMAWKLSARRVGELQSFYPKGTFAERWNLAYPRPWTDLVGAHGAASKVDASFAYAIMRTESGFDARVESYANAVGLMQLLVGTAKEMADANEKAQIDREALKVPDTNIRLGTRFLGRLFRRFGGHPALAAAGYNAGAAPVKKWLAERGQEDLDIFVDSIPYRQTRHYVSSVVGAYGVYTYLQTGTLPLLDLKLPTDGGE